MFCPKCIFPNLGGADRCIVHDADKVGTAEGITTRVQAG
jgi:hypothetical protein